MGKPLMIQIADDQKIEELKNKMGAKTKIEVVREALKYLEIEIEKKIKVDRWIKAATKVGASDLDVLKEFQVKSRFKNLS